jgi:hypothetical protein
VRKVLTAPPIVFKGSGWYSTDSRGGSSKTVDGNGASEKKADDTKTETKTEGKSTESASTSTETASAKSE